MNQIDRESKMQGTKWCFCLPYIYIYRERERERENQYKKYTHQSEKNNSKKKKKKKNEVNLYEKLTNAKSNFDSNKILSKLVIYILPRFIYIGLLIFYIEFTHLAQKF